MRWIINILAAKRAINIIRAMFEEIKRLETRK